MTSVFSSKLRVGLGVVCFWTLVSLPCAAENSSSSDNGSGSGEVDSHTRTAARTLANQGAEAFEHRDYAAALDLFQRAGALVPAPTIVLMEARTLVELGRLVEAADRYSAAKNMTDAEGSNEALQMAIETAAAEAEALKARIPLLTVRIRGDGNVDNAQIFVDGRQLPRALVGVDNPLDPGLHQIEVRRLGRSPIERQVKLREGEHKELVIELASDMPVSSPESAPPTPLLTEAESGSAKAPVAKAPEDDSFGWVILAAGGGATLIGAATGIAALDKQSELDKVCDPGCPGSYSDDIQSFRTLRTVSYAAFALGAAGLAWGGYILLAGEPEAPRAALRLSLPGAAIEGAF